MEEALLDTKHPVIVTFASELTATDDEFSTKSPFRIYSKRNQNEQEIIVRPLIVNKKDTKLESNQRQPGSS